VENVSDHNFALQFFASVAQDCK